MSTSDDGSGVEIHHFDRRDVLPLVRKHCAKNAVELSSVLDIGCGRTRLDGWVAKAPSIAPPKRYIGLEIDDEIRAELVAEGLDVRHPFTPEGKSCDGDLGVALEIIEHLEPEDTVPFLSEYLARTRKLFVLSTPNCEYWKGRRGAAGHELLHFLPDHYTDQLLPRSSPHSHKQAFTPAMLAKAMQDSLPSSRWRFRVYRAWPWTITDHTRPISYSIYYKLFALAWPKR